MSALSAAVAVEGRASSASLVTRFRAVGKELEKLLDHGKCQNYQVESMQVTEIIQTHLSIVTTR